MQTFKKLSKQKEFSHSLFIGLFSKIEFIYFEKKYKQNFSFKS